jgi:hypothetical protein
MVTVGGKFGRTPGRLCSVTLRRRVQLRAMNAPRACADR